MAEEILRVMISGMGVRVPRVYLSWANPVFLAFFSFNRINNLRVFSVAFSPIPTAPTKSYRVGLKKNVKVFIWKVRIPTLSQCRARMVNRSRR